MTATEPLAGWSGLNLQYLIGKADWLVAQAEEDKMRNMQSWDQAPGPETAFLGPQFWDKKLSMKVFNNEVGGSNVPAGGGGGEYNNKTFSTDSPSPPHFQQQVSRSQKYPNSIKWVL